MNFQVFGDQRNKTGEFLMPENPMLRDFQNLLYIFYRSDSFLFKR